MKSNDMPENERESLSALFDGELQGDARRFAARRLAHDTQWQDDCGRWQMIGDVMRRQAPIAAPGDFAARVERAVAAEAAVATASHATAASRRAATPPSRMWVGGALAASLALLALFASRAPERSTGPAHSVAAASPAAVPVPVPVAAPQMPVAVAIPAQPVSLAPPSDRAPAVPVRRVAAVERPPARASSRVPRRGDALAQTVARAGENQGSLAVAPFAAPDSVNPFHVPVSDPLAARPWPRSVLSGAAGLTASYGAQREARTDSPSFYPFEPRTHADADVRAPSP